MVRCFVWLDIFDLLTLNGRMTYYLLTHIMLCFLTQEAGSSMRGSAAMWRCNVVLWTMMPQSRGRWMGQMWKPSGGRKGQDLSSWRWIWVAMACTAVSRILTASGATRSHFASDVSLVVVLCYFSFLPLFSHDSFLIKNFLSTSRCVSHSLPFFTLARFPDSFLIVWPHALFTESLPPLNKPIIAFTSLRCQGCELLSNPIF